jgi:hypothetical protein
VVRLSGDADDDAVELFQIQKGNEGRLQTTIWPRKMTYVGPPSVRLLPASKRSVQLS